MFKFVRSWVVGGALVAVAVVGCRHSESSCPTCGHGPVVSTPTGSAYHETATSPASGYTPIGTSSSAVPMPLPSANGVRVIDTTGNR
jgi:hypothetical protein